jgi:hypothetical protein
MDSEKEGDAVGRKVVQQLQHDGAEALKAKVCVNNWAGRRELDCEVVKETKTRYVCRLLSDGLLPRVRCLQSLISANTPASVPRRIFPWRPSTRFSLFGVSIILSRVWPVGSPGNPHE